MSRILQSVAFSASPFERSAMMLIPQGWEHHLPLTELDEHRTLTDKTSYIHGVVRQRFPCIDRIAIAKYDKGCDTLRTYVGSMKADNPLILYEAKLSEVPSLLNLVRAHETRVVNDMSIFASRRSAHSKQILGNGFLSGYTVPLFNEGEFIGVLFFNSYQLGAFDDSNLGYLDMIAHLLTSMLAAEVAQVTTLRGALKTATQFTYHRDPETGMHLERMARYSRLIARTLGRITGSMMSLPTRYSNTRHCTMLARSPSPTGFSSNQGRLALKSLPRWKPIPRGVARSSIRCCLTSMSRILLTSK